MVKIDTGNPEEKEEIGLQRSIDSSSEALSHSQAKIVTADLITSLASFQNAMKSSNMAAITALSASNLAHQIAKLTNVTLPQVNISSSYNNIFSSIQIDSVRNIVNSVNQIMNGFQFDYSKFAANLGEILKNIPSPYSEDEINEIIPNVERLAEQGWVIYYDFGDVYRRISADNIQELENEWLTQLKTDLSSENVYRELKESFLYPETLIESMFESYKSGNYYAAYTLATLAIDGALNRNSEQVTNEGRIPVGRRSVEVLDKQFVDKSFSEAGLVHWLQIFFKDTNNFTIDDPNRHMIGHGRWEGTIYEKDFLKLFNVILYLLRSIEFWHYSFLENL
ncbi:hypothetical protein [Streptococcus moroccensis]|uniref:Uncharacterized protein n=1 Tax=Streptococcus moroccensis TaxID=1451356 RepID=A0ABT9YPT0_9STRE|nr:hypothetical protein [Streptococcus moroccensis]MDQ0221775.1 hypothetical protein [Streptococcus moroccensis]